MKTLPIAFLLFSLFSCFAFNINPDSRPTVNLSPKEPIEDHRKEVVNTVFNKLKKSLGLTSSDKPNFEFVKAFPSPHERLKGAMIDYKNNTVYFKLSTYNACRKFGKDSTNIIAFLLGHELAHYVNNHSVKNHYTIEFKKDLSDVTFKKIKTNPSDEAKKVVIEALANSLSTETEREADLDGGFIAYLSGYDPYAFGPSFLDTLFNTLGIAPTSDNYPSLAQRKAITTEVEKKLIERINYFETANLLIAVQDYDNALFYYREVLRDFQSREIYNNIGVLYLLSFIEKESPDFIYPIELDLNSRLGTRGDEERDALRRLLEMAIENFEAAIAKDPDYPIAHINKGCAHALLATFDKNPLIKKEQFAIAKAAALSSLVIAAKDDSGRWDNTRADAMTLQGIIEAENGNKTEALSFFNQAIQLPPDSSLAAINKTILLTDENNIPRNISILEIKEEIDGIGITGINLDPEKDLFRKFPKENGKSKELYYQESKHARLLLNNILDQRGNQVGFSSFYITHLDIPTSIVTSKGIKIGDNRQAILDKYSLPNREIGLGDGSWLIYRIRKKSNLIFQLDTKGVLKRWCITNREG